MKFTGRIALYASVFLVIIAACQSAHKSQRPTSEWSFQNRATGEYFYEDNGVLLTGAAATDDRYRWIAEATATEAVRFRNKKTGHVLQLDNNSRPVVREATDTSAKQARWLFKGYGWRNMTSCSWYSVSNEATGDRQFLSQEGNTITVAEKDRDKDYSTQWTVVREGGTALPFAIAPDSVSDASFLGNRIARAVSATEIRSNYHGAGHQWKLQQAISNYPAFTAEGNPMLAALYNMALEEMVLNLRDDSTFRTGKLWPDTWTRDAVYSIYFAFSWMNPSISLNTLRKQTLKNPKEALQDTGTGGSWPISTDRVVWAIAAWEYYLVTGDRNWLAEAYEGLRYTALKDIHVAYDEQVGLFRGEACSMDWRTHTYPNWFSNENIGESFSTGTNALHFFCYGFLEKAGVLLNKEEEEIRLWQHYQQSIQKGLDKYCWNKDKGLYTAYLYPAFLSYKPSDRVDIMSNGLCALLGAASPEQVNSIVAKYPLYPYGGATLYPTIPDDFAYHNKSIWAVWQTPLMYMAKQSGNETVATHLMKSLMRQGAMFLTHKENMTYDTGFDENTALNSDRQLWSVAAYISMVYRMLFGMEMTPAGIRFSPVVPKELVNGKLRLERLVYRDAMVNITIEGTGTTIASLSVNGSPQQLPYVFPATAKGNFEIRLVMQNSTQSQGKQVMNLVNPGPGKDWSPVEPGLQVTGDELRWTPVPGLKYYLRSPQRDTLIQAPYSLAGKPFGYYSVYAKDDKGFASDCSNVVVYSGFQATVEAEGGNMAVRSGAAPVPVLSLPPAPKKPDATTPVTGYSGTGYVKDETSGNTSPAFVFDIPADGRYSLTLRGSNGNGPHDVYCYIRSVLVDGKDIGTFILESSGNWSQWTRSNQLTLPHLTKGKHELRLVLNPEQKGYDNNMSFAKGAGYKNEAYIDCLEIIAL
ncbi:carbohydrate-binding protein [Flavihumibacter petaseus]|uniref:CBM6 domain-containing protein n=1 Tax=Flavihumibacter petaseus NBRC 106054 TaxID=1220578 RepID=A0A0E9N047_9BACT|nr:carbohydrate-binding protein [Flavihumibacter petaseus]GAO43367.1 hypothetical protein FPE01S_02_04720 [Flavihumibacter petaseus NBRC 106054]